MNQSLTSLFLNEKLAITISNIFEVDLIIF